MAAGRLNAFRVSDRHTAWTLCALGAASVGIAITTFLAFPDDGTAIDKNSKVIRQLSENDERLRNQLHLLRDSVTSVRKFEFVLEGDPTCW